MRITNEMAGSSREARGITRFDTEHKEQAATNLVPRTRHLAIIRASYRTGLDTLSSKSANSQ